MKWENFDVSDGGSRGLTNETRTHVGGIPGHRGRGPDTHIHYSFDRVRVDRSHHKPVGVLGSILREGVITLLLLR